MGSQSRASRRRAGRVTYAVTTFRASTDADTSYVAAAYDGVQIRCLSGTQG
jgi:hypothetical protein